ncbi:hypothetical protein [Actinoplanes sp. NBRC 101535]|uniref:hypothetical protein n=1 Tax=Actinoplanes sp. NBRC 101535 TaxID=3032196 RepID=UPI0024A5BB90|nr:hypothetical protein [Actinoplanes sp. NBRC 101535]GLY02660.1 hypothetical protein Acsp01_30390 [Actinoplanes sp. NBRC 101535]
MRLRMRHETISMIFDTVYAGLMTNALLVLACLPVVALLITTDPGRSWPLLVLAAPLCAPALCAAFTVLSAFTAERSSAVVRTFITGWRATAKPALAAGGLTTAGSVVLGVDAVWAWGRPVGAVVLPLIVVMMTLLAATGLLTLVVIAERPAVRLRDAAAVAVHLAVRRWYLTAFSLLVVALFWSLLAARPALALGVAASPLLYVIWANSRFSIAPLLQGRTA